MMGDGVRPGKNSTCFTVLSLAVAKEQRVGSGIIVPQLTGLSHKTTGQHGPVVGLFTSWLTSSMVRSQETNTNGRTKNIERKRFIFISVLEFEGKIEADHAFGRIGEILVSRIGVFVVELLPDEQVGADNGEFKPLENPAAGEQIRKIVADGHRADRKSTRLNSSHRT